MHPELAKKALKGLRNIESSVVLEDLRIPPGNKLEALKGDRKGQHSIRVNEQWRICFRWENGHAYDVEFCDYH
jgi:proteic killer suppression protein